jgi:UDP-glucose 4-epimerase
VDDVVSALVAAATAPNVNGLVINVGSGVETSVRDLIKSVLDVTNSTAEVIYNAQTSGGVSHMRADLSLAKEKLGYRPSLKLEDGLRLTMKRDNRFK